jgi:YesN/AraC family two-component response regulator
MTDPAAATILVVDDDPGIRDALHVILDDDYQVIDAVDRDEALAALASKKVDLILLDLILGHGDGFEVLEDRREEQKKIPIIIISGLNNAWTAATAVRMGAVDYVTKPFDEDDLLQLIGDTLMSRVTVRNPTVLLVGLDLGIYASLAVLLRHQCWVTRAETLLDALTLPAPPRASLLVIDLSSFGSSASATLPRLRQHFPNAELVVIDSAERSFAASIVLKAPAQVTDLLTAVRRHVATADAVVRQYGARVRSILDHLGTCYAEASVRRLARAIGGAPDYLSACFREETGLSLKTYTTALRIEAAKWLLLEAGEKIEAVAARVGLHDASHLSRLFVRYAGARPGAYRRGSRPAL